MSAYLGIDPGLDGAVCVIAGEDVEFFDTPTYQDGKRRRLDVAACSKILRNFRNERGVQAFLELVGTRPGEGSVGAFSFGRGLGNWEGILAALQIPYQLVRPQAWKAALMPGEPKEKDASRVVARRLFPAQTEEALSRKKDHNRADALLIAEFGRRRLASK
jgi:crossover junction endodeoxyribonuclease RuvC